MRNILISSFLLVSVLQITFSDAFRLAKIKRSTVEPCLQKPNSGMCMALFINWYYDSTEETCNKFVYGGCGGNDNNFQTGEECVSACGGTIVESDRNIAPIFSPDPDRCESDVKTGPCKKSMIRYYFNGENCETFVYGGCFGNSNNFETKEECLLACAHKVPSEENEY